jgi:hypothetical protein
MEREEGFSLLCPAASCENPFDATDYLDGCATTKENVARSLER